MKTTVRLLTLLLALVLVFTLMPAAARAEETTPETGITVGEIPFQVNPLYEGIVTEENFDLPDPPEIDPTQIGTHATTYLSVEEAGAEVRKHMKNREESFSVNVAYPTSSGQTAGERVIAAALTHTGVATEGDYLMWQYGGWGGNYSRSYNSTLQQYEYTFNFTFTYYTTAAQEKEVNTAVTNLINSLGVKNKSDYEKICAVYDWICANVTYDYANLEDTSYMLKHTAYAALIDRTAVCQGYALLFYRLMLELGVDNRLIAGLSADADGNAVAHGWNIVQLGDYYYSVDSTWDAGVTEYSFFLTNTWNFYNHYRYLDYESWEFHEEYPMAAENYDPNVTAQIDPYIYLGMCGEEAYWLLYRDGTLEIFGSGETDEGTSSVSDYTPEWEYWRENVTSVVVDEGITEIGHRLFVTLNNLEEVTLPSSVTYIGGYAFQGCKNLKTINFPEGLVKIDSSAFENCTSLEAVEFPSTLTNIESSAFRNCDSLQEVTIPSTVTSLGLNAFQSCNALHTVNVDISIIRYDRFCDNPSLVNINLGKNVNTIQSGAFENCDGLTVLEIPGTVTSLNGFAGCDNLTTLILHEGTVEIGTSAFEDCVSLTSVTFPGSVTTIGSSSFANCDSLKEVTIPETVTKLSSSFKDCDGLTTVYLYCSEVGGYAFAECDALSKIVLGGQVKTVAPYAFDNCDSLTDLEAAGTVESLSGFSNCDNLVNVTLEEGLKEIGQYAFQNCTSLARIRIPGTVEAVRSYAFDNCDLLTEITIPGSVVTLSGFSNCDNLTTVHFSEGLEELGEAAFQNCAALTDVQLPDSLLYIQKNAFGNCDQFTTMELPENLILLGGFANCDNLAQIEIPDSVQEIGVSAFQNCKSLNEVEFSAGLKTIGEDAFNSCHGLTEVNFPNGLETIDEDAFYNCIGLTEVTIPASVTYLSGFRACNNLETATVYSSGTLGSYAFSSCKRLKNVYLLGEITKMGSEIFRYCDSLQQITLPSSMTVTEDFMDCASLQTVIINGDTKFEGYAFYNCSSLRNVIINGVVTDVKSPLLDRCVNVEHITFKDDVIKISSLVAPALKTVTFLGDAPAFSANALNGRILTIYYPANNSTWDGVAGQSYGGTITWVPIGKPQKLEVVKVPHLTSYVVGDTLNLDGILLKATYADGTERDVHMCDLEIVSCDMSSAGKKTAKVSCQGVTVTFPVYVHENEMTVMLDPATYPAVEKNTLSGSEENVQTISWPGAHELILVFNYKSDVNAISNNMTIYNQNEEEILCYSGTEIGRIIVVVPGDTAKIVMAAGSYLWNCNYSFDAIYAVNPIHTGSGGTTVPPTCTEEGHITDLVCEVCGAEVEDQVLPVIDHDYAATVTVPTCEAQGYTTHTCAMCGDSYVDDYTDPVDHSYEDGICIWCGYEPFAATWKYATTSLDGTINLNIYVDMSGSLAKDPNTFVRFICAGVITDVPIKKALESMDYGELLYRFSLPLSAKQVSDTVTVQVMNGEETVGKALEYSIMKYCVNRIAKSPDAAEVAACKALLNYSAAAQVYFDYNTDNLANASLSEEDKILPTADVAEYTSKVIGSQEGIKATEATLMLESMITVRVYFKVSEGYSIDDYTFYVDGAQVAPKQNEKGYYLETEGIPARKMDEMHTFTVGGLTVEYGPLCYVRNKLNATDDPVVVNMVNALYAYFKAAEAVLG